MVTRPRDRFTASPHSMISTRTSPATCATHNTAKRLPNNLVNYLPRTLVFSFAFLRDKKLRLIIVIYSISGRNWNQSTMENGLLYTVSPVHENAIWNIITISHRIFRPKFSAISSHPKIYWICAAGNLKGIGMGILRIWTVDIREWNTWRT